MEGTGRQRPAITILDVISLSPVEAYGVLATLAVSPDPAVSRALSCAVARILAKTRATG